MERNHPPTNFFLNPQQQHGLLWPIYAANTNQPGVGADATNFTTYNDIYGKSGFLPNQQNQILLRVFERPVDPDDPGGEQTVLDSNGYYLVHKYDFTFGTPYNTDASTPILVPMRLYIPSFMNISKLEKDDIVWGIWESVTVNSPDSLDDSYYLLKYVQQDGGRPQWAMAENNDGGLTFKGDKFVTNDDDLFTFFDTGGGDGFVQSHQDAYYYVHCTLGVRLTDNIVCEEPTGACFDPIFEDPTQESWASCIRDKITAAFAGMPRTVIDNLAYFNHDSAERLKVKFDLISNTIIYDSDHPCNLPDQPENLQTNPLLTTVVIQGITFASSGVEWIPVVEVTGGFPTTYEWAKLSIIFLGPSKVADKHLD